VETATAHMTEQSEQGACHKMSTTREQDSGHQRLQSTPRIISADTFSSSIENMLNSNISTGFHNKRHKCTSLHTEQINSRLHELKKKKIAADDFFSQNTCERFWFICDIFVCKYSNTFSAFHLSLRHFL